MAKSITGIGQKEGKLEGGKEKMLAHVVKSYWKRPAQGQKYTEQERMVVDRLIWRPFFLNSESDVCCPPFVQFRCLFYIIGRDITPIPGTVVARSARDSLSLAFHRIFARLISSRPLAFRLKKRYQFWRKMLWSFLISSVRSYSRWIRNSDHRKTIATMLVLFVSNVASWMIE